MGVIRVLFYVLLGYYIFKIVFRLLTPFLARYVQRKSQDIFRNAYEQQRTSYGSGPQVGDVVVEKQTGRSKKSKKPVGEYISYEEVE